MPMASGSIRAGMMSFFLLGDSGLESVSASLPISADEKCVATFQYMGRQYQDAAGGRQD